MNNDKKVLYTTFAFAGGIGIGAVFASLLFLADNNRFMFVIASFFAIGGLLFLTRYMIEEFISPYIRRKNAAAKALGREGIKIMHKDKTAQVAYKGIYSILKEDFPKAEDYLQQALAMADIRQNQTFCIEWLIKLYEAMGNESKLMWCFRKSVEYAPDNSEAQSRLGHAYFSEGKLDQAMYCFEQALKYDPNNGYSYFNIAKIQMLHGEDSKAYETLQKLLQINENHPLVHAELADYYAMQGDAEKAEEECKKAQLCGIREPEELSRRVKAILSFNSTEYGENDLPSLFYRRIEPSYNDTVDDKWRAHD